MNLTWEKLDSHIASSLAPLYVIAGEEITLVNDAYDQVKATAQQRGFNRYQRFDLTDYQWSEIENELATPSLFGDKSFVDIVLNRNGMNRPAVTAIESYLEDPNLDLVVLVRGLSFEWRQRQNKWFKFLAQHPVAVIFTGESIPRWDTTKWITYEANRFGLTMDPAAMDLLATLNEGNLDAVKQELARLALVSDEGQTISIDQIGEIDQSVGDVFELLNQALSGNADGVEKLLRALSTEDRNFFPLQGALTSKLRQALELRRNGNMRLSRTQKQLLDGFNRRVSENQLLRYLDLCAVLDSQAKGIHRLSIWMNLRSLLLDICGIEKCRLDTHAQWLRIDYTRDH